MLDPTDKVSFAAYAHDVYMRGHRHQNVRTLITMLVRYMEHAVPEDDLTKDVAARKVVEQIHHLMAEPW
jgi:hypothetical protein